MARQAYLKRMFSDLNKIFRQKYYNVKSIVFRKATHIDILQLVRTGAQTTISQNVKLAVNQLVSRYKLNPDSVIKGPENISFPIHDDIVMGVIFQEINKVVEKYYKVMYHAKCILQDCPRLVITFPEKHHKRGSTNTKIPENFHKDYLSELTVHVPLFDINTYTPYTEYVENTHCQPRLLDRFFVSKKLTGRIKGKKMYCSAGDFLIMDVNGLHRGSTENRESPRFMIQYKYVSIDFKEETNLETAFKAIDIVNKIKSSFNYTLSHYLGASNLIDLIELHSKKYQLQRRDNTKPWRIFDMSTKLLRSSQKVDW